MLYIRYMYMAHSVSKNTIMFVTASVLQKVVAFVYFAFAARMLGKDLMGQYLLIVSFGSVFGIFVDVGVAGYLIREVAKDITRVGKLFFVSIIIKLPLTIITYGLVIGTLLIGNYDSSLYGLIALTVGVAILDMVTTSIYSIFRGLHKLNYESISVVVFQSVIAIAGITFVLVFGVDVRYLVFALLCGSAGNFLYAGFLFIRKIGFSQFRWDKEVARVILIGALPFFFLGLFTRLLTYFDPMLLMKFAGEKFVSFYGVAFKTTFAFQFIPAAVAASLYPAYTSYFKENREKLKEVFYAIFKYLIIISLPICFGIIGVADVLIDKLYGNEYAPATSALVLLACAIPFVFVSYSSGALINGSFRHNKNVIMLGIAVGLYITLNIILIPFYAHVGTAIAALLTYIFMTVRGFWIIKDIVEWKASVFASLIYPSLIASCAMLLVVWWLNSNFYIEVIAGIIVYCGLLILLKGITIQDTKYITQFIRRP